MVALVVCLSFVCVSTAVALEPEAAGVETARWTPVNRRHPNNSSNSKLVSLVAERQGKRPMQPERKRRGQGRRDQSVVLAGRGCWSPWTYLAWDASSPRCVHFFHLFFFFPVCVCVCVYPGFASCGRLFVFEVPVCVQYCPSSGVNHVVCASVGMCAVPL